MIKKGRRGGSEEEEEEDSGFKDEKLGDFVREEDEGYNDVVAAGKRKKFSSLNERRKKGNGG